MKLQYTGCKRIKGGRIFKRVGAGESRKKNEAHSGDDAQKTAQQRKGPLLGREVKHKSHWSTKTNFPPPKKEGEKKNSVPLTVAGFKGLPTAAMK